MEEENGRGETPMDVESAAKFLGLSRWTIYAKTSAREIPFHKKAGKIFFYRQELNDWLKDQDA